MKILYHHRIASKDGQYVHVEELTRAFAELGHELCFVAPAMASRSDFGHDGGFVTRLKKILPKSLYELLELSYSLVVAVKLIRAVVSYRPDFIYERYNLYQPAGVFVARMFGVPIFLEVNAPLVDERSKYSGLSLRRLARAIENFTWKQATVVLPVTEVLARMIEKIGVDRKDICVIHNGVSEKLLTGVFAEKAEFEIERIRIGFVGFINPWHRLDLAIEAIASHREMDIHLVCVGEGDIRANLEQLAASLGISDRVTFTGLLSREAVFDEVARFDIALQPSVVPYASPLKLFEYLGASCLIIAPRTHNILEIVTEEEAILFEKDDFDDFSAKLSEAIEHFAQFSPKRHKARRVIESRGFTWQENARRIIDMANALKTAES